MSDCFAQNWDEHCFVDLFYLHTGYAHFFAMCKMTCFKLWMTSKKSKSYCFKKTDDRSEMTEVKKLK